MSEVREVVYLVTAEIGGPVKIGRTRADRVKSRLKELQTGNPQPLRVVRMFSGGRDLEQHLHKVFGPYRIGAKGEWFEYAGPVRNMLEAPVWVDPDTCETYLPLCETGDGLMAVEQASGTTIISHDGVAWSIRALCEELASYFDQHEVDMWPSEVADSLCGIGLISIDELKEIERCDEPTRNAVAQALAGASNGLEDQ